MLGSSCVIILSTSRSQENLTAKAMLALENTSPLSNLEDLGHVCKEKHRRLAVGVFPISWEPQNSFPSAQRATPWTMAFDLMATSQLPHS